MSAEPCADIEKRSERRRRLRGGPGGHATLMLMLCGLRSRWRLGLRGRARAELLDASFQLLDGFQAFIKLAFELAQALVLGLGERCRACGSADERSRECGERPSAAKIWTANVVTRA